MTAEGKINAAKLQRGDLILVTRDAARRVPNAPGTDGLHLSRLKREAIQAVVLGVAGVQVESGSFHRSTARRYVITTDQGTLENLAPIQTMWHTGQESEATVRELEETGCTVRELEERKARQEADRKHAERKAWHAEHPNASIRYAERTSAHNPEPGWMSQCLRAECVGHWRTGLESELAARQAYEAHQCDFPTAVCPIEGPHAKHIIPGTTRQECSGEDPRQFATEGTEYPARKPEPAYVDLGVTVIGTPVKVAPIGTPAPGPEDLADLAQELERGPIDRAAILAKPIDSLMNSGVPAQCVDCGASAVTAGQPFGGTPEGRTGPKCRRHAGPARTISGLPAPGTDVPGRRDRVVPGDVVTIHRGDALWEVLRAERDTSVNRRTRDVTDLSMARVAPCGPDSDKDARWVGMDLLHRVRPVAHIRTTPVSLVERLGLDAPVEVTGSGWDPARGTLRQVAVERDRVVLLPWPAEERAIPAARVRVGDALVVDGQCFAILWEGDDREPHLKLAPWRNR
jgi:hypothetical protein